MKIAIININSRYIHSSLAPWYLKSSIDEKIHDVCVIEYTINGSVAELLQEIILIKPDIVALCCYIWNIEFVKSLLFEIHQFEKICPTLILGGPEVSYNPKYYIDEYNVDYIICGEGEIPFSKLIDAIEKNQSSKMIGGVKSKLYDGGIHFDTVIPSSPYSKDYFKALNKKISYIETSRGCPFRCSFCLSGRNERVKYFPIDRVKEEIVALANSGTKTIKFVDRSFNANSKHALEIVKHIKKLSGEQFSDKIQFHFEIAADILTDELMDEFCNTQNGLFRLEIGLQSFNTQTLDAINRNTNVDTLKKNIYRLTSNKNLHIHIDLIAGLPYEDYNSFKNGFNIAFKLNADVIQLGFLKLLRGSPMESQPKGIFCDKAPYEVKSTPWISENELKELKGVEEVVDKIYNTHRFDRTMQIAISKFYSPFDLFYNLYRNVGAPHNESMFELANRLLNYLKEVCDYDILIDAMESDLRAVNPVGRTPKFIKEHRLSKK